MSVTAGPNAGAMDRLLLGLKRLELGQTNSGAYILFKEASQSIPKSASVIYSPDAATKQQVATMAGTEGPVVENRCNQLGAVEPGFMKPTTKALAAAQEGAGRVAHRKLSSPAKRPWVVANWNHIADIKRPGPSNISPAAAAAYKVCATSQSLGALTKRECNNGNTVKCSLAETPCNYLS